MNTSSAVKLAVLSITIAPCVDHMLVLLLQTSHLDGERRLRLERRLGEIAEWLAPPVFDRPRSHEQQRTG